jgi:hypothetical protein
MGGGECLDSTKLLRGIGRVAFIECGEASQKFLPIALMVQINLFNEQYFLLHPFPGRTYVLAAKYTF